jgi:Catalytic LigB subunit of aromatic ring-opening dioxygenase
MGEILGIGTTHVPYLMSAPESLPRIRDGITKMVERMEGRPFVDPPEALEQLHGDVEGVTREHHQLHWKAFATLREYIDEVKPDAIMFIGDDQAQCFQSGNVPPYALYVGDQVDAKPFYGSRAPADAEYVQRTWGVGTDHQYLWPCHADLAVAIRDGLIRDGFEISSSDNLNHDKWQNGLGHAHTNTQMFLRNEDGKYPIIPLFINCYGSELNTFGTMFASGRGSREARETGYPPAASSRRLYEMGRAIRKILLSRNERVLVCPSSTWSHTWLTKRYHRMRMDVEGNFEKMRWFEKGQASLMAEYDSPDMENNGDLEMRNWIVAAGIMGNRRFEVTWQVTSWALMGFRVYGIWR